MCYFLGVARLRREEDAQRAARHRRRSLGFPRSPPTRAVLGSLELYHLKANTTYSQNLCGLIQQPPLLSVTPNELFAHELDLILGVLYVRAKRFCDALRSSL